MPSLLVRLDRGRDKLPEMPMTNVMNLALMTQGWVKLALEVGAVDRQRLAGSAK
jgi:hypothetical protein